MKPTACDTKGLPRLLNALQESLRTDLENARMAIDHCGTKGAQSEGAWVDVLNRYLPKRYLATQAIVIDSNNNQSDQIDVVIHDRQYTPVVFNYMSTYFVPAESVYAVFEVKQNLSKENIKYAGNKAASVRKLHRTSIPIPHAGGEYPAKAVSPIIGGLLTLSSDWNPPFGSPFSNALEDLSPEAVLDIGCVVESGVFKLPDTADKGKIVEIVGQHCPLAAFLLNLLSKLQRLGTVPMLDVEAYVKWCGSERIENERCHQ